MRVLFVGLLYDPHREAELLSKSKVGISVASNQYQWNTIEGLRGNCVDVSVIGSAPLGSYPRRSTELVVHSSPEQVDQIAFQEVGFLNLSLIKDYCRKKSISDAIDDWLLVNGTSDCKPIIVFYDLYKPFIQIAERLKREKRASVCVCFIVPDLVGTLRNDMGYGRIKQVLLNISSKKVLSRLSIADGFVFLTEQMNEVVNTGNSPYIVIDGIVDDEASARSFQLANEKRIIMYAGLLSAQYNIDRLLHSFLRNKELDNLELWFCGKGDAEHLIQSAMRKDSRVKYFGFLSKEDIRSLEQKITFYINPRSNNGEYTKYSFPSKNLEYLLSGKPVIAFKLNGMSDDYDDVLLFMNDDNEFAFDNMLIKAASMSMSEINQIGEEGLKFVKQHNGKTVQGRRLYDFLGGIATA